MEDDVYNDINNLASKLGAEKYFTDLADAVRWVEDRYSVWVWPEPYFTTDCVMFWKCMAVSDDVPKTITLSLDQNRFLAMAKGLVSLMTKINHFGSLRYMFDWSHEIFK